MRARGKIPAALLTLLVLAAVAAFLPVSDDAYGDSVTLNGITYSYTVSGGTATAEGAESGDVDIPGSISVNGIQYAVTTVNLVGFSQCTSLNIPSSVTQINAGAAQDQKLTSVTVDANNGHYRSEDGVVLSKDGSQFVYYPMGLVQSHYTIPSGVTALKSYSFYGNGGPAVLVLADSVETVEAHVCCMNDSLESVNLKKAAIDCTSFVGCTALEEFTVSTGSPYTTEHASNAGILVQEDAAQGVMIIKCPAKKVFDSPDLTFNNVDGVADYAFAYVSTLDSVAEGGSTPSGKAFVIDDNAFINSTIGSVTLNGSCSVGDSVFENCTSLTNVRLGSGVYSMGDAVFRGCTAITSVTIADSNMSMLPDSTFEGCSSLNALNSDSSHDGVNLTTYERIGANAFKGCTSISAVNTNGVKSFGDRVFEGCTALTSLTIEAGLESWNATAFYGCTSLSSVSMPPENNNGYGVYDGVVGICHSSLNPPNNPDVLVLVCGGYYTGDRSEFVIPESISSIAANAFSGCSGLTSVTILRYVNSIADRSFDNCTGLESITVVESNEDYKSVDGVLYGITSGVTLLVYPQGKGDTSFTIPADVTDIDYRAFLGNSTITSFAVEEGNTKYQSMNGTLVVSEETQTGTAYGLVIVPRTVTDYTIPEQVTFIDAGAFSGSIQTITFPSGSVQVNANALMNCDALRSIIITDGTTEFEPNSIVFEDGASHIINVNGPSGYTIPSTAASGSVTFTYGEDPGPEPGPGPDPGPEPTPSGGDLTIPIVGGVVVILAMIGIALYLRTRGA